MSRFNRELQLTLQAAMREAILRRHAYLTVEHLLLALCHDERGAEVLRHSRREPEAPEGRPRALPRRRDRGRARRGADRDRPDARVPPRRPAGARARRQRRERRGRGRAIWSRRSSRSPTRTRVALLRAQGVSRLDVLKYISHGVSKLPDSRSAGETGSSAPASGATDRRRRRGRRRSARGLRHQPHRARARRASSIRWSAASAEIDRVIHVLARRRKNNPILVGEIGRRQDRDRRGPRRSGSSRATCPTT